MAEFCLIDDASDLVRDDRRTDRRIARAEAFGDGHHIGANVERVATPPIGRATKATDHFVGDQKNFMLVANPLNLRPVAGRRNNHASCALNGFRDKGGHFVFAQLCDFRLKLARTLKPEFLRIHVSAFSKPVRLVNVHNVGNRQAALGVHGLHSTQRRRSHGRAMIGILAADNDGFLRFPFRRPIVSNKANIGVVRLGTAACEEHVVHVFGCQFRHFCRQRNCRHMGRLEKGVVIGQLLHLARCNVGDLIAAITDIDAPKTRHRIQVFVAFAVSQSNAIGRRDDTCSFGAQLVIVRERVHVVRRVDCLQLGGGHVVCDLVHLSCP